MDERLRCTPSEECKYAEHCMEAPFQNRHHMLWPSNEYSRGQARRLRAILVTPICAALHDEIHHQTRPPQRPSQERILDMLIHQDETYARFMDNLLRQVEGLNL